MTIEQVEEAAVRVTSEMGHIQGLDEITNAFDKTEVGLILATGVRKYHEYQSLKGKEKKKTLYPTTSCRRSSDQTREPSWNVHKATNINTLGEYPQKCHSH